MIRFRLFIKKIYIRFDYKSINLFKISQVVLVLICSFFLVEEKEYYDEYEEELEEGVFHRVLDMAFDDVPTSSDGLMEDYYLVL